MMEGMDVSAMPRGGPDAGLLDRLLQTDVQEYLDGDDGPRKRSVVRALGLTAKWFGTAERLAAIVLERVADIPDPRILELDAGHGGLSTTLLDMHPTVDVTVADVRSDAVPAIGDVDIDGDGAGGRYALAVFALSFHHLPPEAAVRVLAEGSRVADELLIIDVPRPPAPLHLARVAALLPWAPFVPLAHDGVISSLRCYGPAALRALAEHAGVDVELRGGSCGPQVAVVTRR